MNISVNRYCRNSLGATTGQSSLPVADDAFSFNTIILAILIRTTERVKPG